MRLSSFLHTHSLTQLGRMSDRRSVGTSERDQLSEIIFMFLVFTFAMVLILSLRKLRGFLLYGFPEENLCLLSLVIIVVHVIFSDKILDHIA